MAPNRSGQTKNNVIIVNDASPTIANETSMSDWPILQSQVISQATIVAGHIDEHQNEDHQPLVDSAPSIIHDESDNPSQTPADTCSPPVGNEKNSFENENQGNQPKAKQLDWTFLENGQLFGRQREIESVEQALERRLKPNAKPELILISGSSGSGKTVLARKLQKPVEEKGGFFVMGKFDQFKRPEPYAPLVAAMTAFAMHILGNGVEVVAETRQAILESVGEDIGVLTVLIPALEEIVGLQSPNILKGSKAQERLRSIFCRLVRASCSLKRPLALIMDDLQWADVGSLELLEAIISDPMIHGLALVGICRSNEVALSHDFAVTLRRLEDKKGTIITNIEVGSLTLEGTNRLISSVLGASQEHCKFISHTLQAKTNGNAFFLLVFLKALYEDRVLVPDDDNTEWLWDDNIWARRLEDTNDVVDLIVQRIQKLPEVCQLLLLMSACLGTELDELLLFKLIDHSTNVDEALIRCSSAGILIIDTNSERYRFSHDRIQQASYYLIPEEERPLFHLSIGRQLMKTLTEVELSGYIFVVVDQMIRGKGHLDDESEKVELAYLCLQAGQRSFASSDFKTALRYLELGEFRLNARRKWIAQYTLTLNLYNAKAEAYCCLADFDGMEKAVGSIFMNARSFDDKLRAYMLRIYSLGALMRFQDGIKLALGVLERLGEKFPKSPDLLTPALPSLVANLLNVKRMLWRKTDAEILGLLDMRDPHKLSTMGVLHMLITCCFLGGPGLFPFVALRMVKLSLQHGLSAISSMGFACYGLLLCGMGDFDGANRFVRLSLCIVERYSSVRSDWIPRVYTILHGFITPWTLPIRSTFDFLEQAHRVGLERGDIEYAWMSHHTISTNSFLAGEPLRTLEPVFRKSIAQMRDYKQEAWAELTQLCHEATLILMKRGDDPIVVNGALKSLGKGSNRLKEVQSTANLNFEVYLCFARCYFLMVSYHLGELDVALAMAKKSENASSVIPASQFSAYQVFYNGLTALTIVRQKQASSFSTRRELLSRARRSLTKLRKYAKHCSENWYHRVLLLEAEFAALRGDLELAMYKYVLSEELAARAGFLEVQGLACERAGLTLRQLGGDNSVGTKSLERAIDVYTKWGASEKVDRMKKLLNRQIFVSSA